MIVKDNRAETPHGNSIIWKYYGLDKFLDLLFNESLFFTNANKMTDKYEGLIPKRNEKHILKTAEKDKNEQFYQKHFIDIINALKKLTLINCWTINRDESYALWKIYLGGAKSGVAIRSTVSKLENAIRLGKDSFDEDIYISKVKYTGFIEKDPLNRFNVITTKNRFYEYESEMRLFIFNYAPSEGGYETPYDIGIGRRVKVDLNELIEKIYISPFSGKWFHESFLELLKRVNPKLIHKINYSEILDD